MQLSSSGSQRALAILQMTQKSEIRNNESTEEKGHGER